MGAVFIGRSFGVVCVVACLIGCSKNSKTGEPGGTGGAQTGFGGAPANSGGIPGGTGGAQTGFGGAPANSGGIPGGTGGAQTGFGGAPANSGGTSGGVDGALGDASVELPPPCSTFGSSTTTGTLFSGATGMSGIVASRKQSGVLWIHSDHQKNIYAIDKTGKLLGQWELATGSKFFWIYDWEDISIQSTATGPDQIWIADMGNNAVRDDGGSPRTSIQIMSIDEPTIDSSQVIVGTVQIVGTFEFTYPDRPHDAEAMAVDPLTGDMYIFSKEETAPSKIFRAKAPLKSGELEYVADINSNWLNGADFSPSGRELLVRNYTSVFYWTRPADKTWSATLSSPPNKEIRLQMKDNYYGEAIAFSIDESGFYIVSEENKGSPPSPVEFYAKACKSLPSP
jgi:hypothetical protein